MVDDMETFGGALEDVRAFCMVVELGTISAAARQLNETKGGISRRVTRLERQLGVALLARTPRAVTPTNEGAVFFARAREALTWLEDAVEGARRSRHAPQGHLRVTAPMDFGLEVLPQIIVKFRASHPQITVELLVTDTPLDLAANRIDLALRAQEGNLPDMGYRASVVARFRVGLYSSPTYLGVKTGGIASPADLADHDLLLPREMCSPGQLILVDQRGRRQVVDGSPVVRSGDFASIMRLTIAGGGIGPVPMPVAEPAVRAGTLVPVLSEWTALEANLYAISLNGDEAPARVRVFREFVRAELN